MDYQNKQTANIYSHYIWNDFFKKLNIFTLKKKKNLFWCLLHSLLSLNI